MALPDILAGLLQPAAYPHACGAIRLVETHISWILLTGDYAYKIKKPVRLPFVDFSTLERRRFFCVEELRCNRAFAPGLYLDLVAVVRDGAGRISMGGSGELVDWAVQMRQFPAEVELERRLESGQLTMAHLADFGARLAGLHEQLPRHAGHADEVDARILAPVEENFTTLLSVVDEPELRAQVRRIRVATRRLGATLAGCFAARLGDGHLRECHGDLHLGNLVWLEAAVTPFDCLEFDANLRWIDTMSDVAFLFMDCSVRGRADLAYAFLDGYLDASGDYPGAELLGFYAAYRALVRAKVAALQSHAPQLRRQLDWSQAWLERPPGAVILMSGLSGSGKSYLAERLAPALPAVRLRSDVARRQAAGSDGGAASRSERYSAAGIDAVYHSLFDLAERLLMQGQSVILDATFLEARHRQEMCARAVRHGARPLIVHCHAPQAVLVERVRKRQATGRDPSEADLAVLAQQAERWEDFSPAEPVLEVNTGLPLSLERLEGLRSAILARLTAVGG